MQIVKGLLVFFIRVFIRCGAAYLEKMHKIYGPVVRIWLSTSRLLVSVNDSDLSKLVLMSARDRPPSTLKIRLPAANSMVFASEREVRQPSLCLVGGIGRNDQE